MSVITATRSIGHNSSGALPILTGTLEDIALATIIRRRQIDDLNDLIDAYHRTIRRHRRPANATDDQFLRTAQASLSLYRTQTSAAVILRYYDPDYSPES